MVEVGQLSHLAVQYWAIALIIGLALSFFGYYLLRTSLAIVGFIGGLYIGQMLWSTLTSQYSFNFSPSNASMIHLAVILIVAFVITTLFIAFYKLAIFLAGFFAGGMVVYYLYNWIVNAFNVKITVANNSDLVSLGVFLTFGVIVGLVTLKSERRAVGTALAALGALIVAYSLMIPLSKYFNVKADKIIPSLTDGSHTLMLTVFVSIFLAVSILSVGLQVGRSKGKKKGGNS